MMEADKDKKEKEEPKTPAEQTTEVAPTETTQEGASETVLKEFEVLQKELLYLKAEFENYKKRILREQDQAIRFANEKFVREILTIVDLLERATTHGLNMKQKNQGGNAELGQFIDGIDMTYRGLLQLLNRFGVEFIGSEGEKFDPVRHEAISQKEVGVEGVGTVLEVLQKGCLLHGRLLKPAKVVVGKNKPEK